MGKDKNNKIQLIYHLQADFLKFNFKTQAFIMRNDYLR